MIRAVGLCPKALLIIACSISDNGSSSTLKPRLKKVCLKDVNQDLKHLDPPTYRRFYEIIGEGETIGDGKRVGIKRILAIDGDRHTRHTNFCRQSDVIWLRGSAACAEENQFPQRTCPRVHNYISVSHSPNFSGNLSPLVQREDVLSLLTLVTVFSCEGLDWQSVSSVGHRYLSLMRRRLMHCEGDSRETTFSKYKSGLCDIKELSLILQRMALAPNEQQQQQQQSQQQQQGVM